MYMPFLIKETTSLSIALEERDAYTEGHCDRVEALCLRLGTRCGLNVLELKLLHAAAKLHDIGKIGIPDKVLLKPGKLDPEEWEVMKTHAELGQRICKAIPDEHAVELSIVVRHHHENFGGGGYPDGLVGEQIPICSRIIAVVDSYDAMITTRPYHQPRSHDYVMGILKSESGKKIDPFAFAEFEKFMAHPPQFRDDPIPTA